MPTPDYAVLYHDYWRRPDRWGSSSFSDAGQIADQVLSVCGGGRTLDAGCGMGALVRTLLARGVDAVGADVAAPVVDEGNRLAAGRFFCGSLLDLPFADGQFQTVVCTDVLEHLAEQDVERAIAQLARVARHNVFVTLSTAPDRDNTWHLTVRPRVWWEDRFLRAGLRKHPLAQTVLPFAALEHEGAQITIVLEKIPAGAAATYPLESLAASRDLHMDMLREGGRRSDAHVARYTLATDFVRPGDTVLDAACGMGYGAAILGAGSRAARVIGVDADAGAVAYAAANYGVCGAVEFRSLDASDLSFLADRSVDVVVSFETLEHIPDPRRMLAEFGRVLTPGGRLIVSVPNQWTDESGRDPNPHHLHVYTWETLAAQLAEGFLIERAYAQTAGGGMKLAERPRRLDEITFKADPAGDHALRDPAEAEWFLAVAMKSPLLAGKEGYRETAYPDHTDLPEYSLTTFARDYDNPWLVRSLVSIGMRCTNRDLLGHLARGALVTARRGSPDEGAALCVLGYWMSESQERAGVSELLARIGEYRANHDSSAQALRWSVSTQYVAALLMMKSGDRAGARETFLRCARTDCLAFSPLLASKTVDAYFRAGLLSASDGDAAGARECWTAGLEEARRVLTGDWTNIWGAPERPVTFGLPEVAVLADAASRCSYGLDVLDTWGVRPATAWKSAVRQTYGDHRAWIQTLTGAKDWLERELAAAREAAHRREEYIHGLRALIEAREQELARGAAADPAGIDDGPNAGRGTLREQLTALETANRWLKDQADAWHRATEDRERVIADLRTWNGTLLDAKRFFEGQCEILKERAATQDRLIEELRAWAGKLEEAKEWHSGQVRAWEANAKEQATDADALRTRAAGLEQECLRWKTLAEARERTILELTAAPGNRAGGHRQGGSPVPRA